MQLTYMSTYGAKCVHSLVMVRNQILFGTELRGPHVFDIAIIETGNNRIDIQLLCLPSQTIEPTFFTKYP